MGYKGARTVDMREKVLLCMMENNFDFCHEEKQTVFCIVTQLSEIISDVTCRQFFYHYYLIEKAVTQR